MRALTCAVAVVAALVAGPIGGRAEDGKPRVRVKAKDEQALRARVTEWWTARQQRDHATMYRLYDPRYRARTSEAQFGADSAIRTRFTILSHEITSIHFETSDTARVRIAYQFQAPKLGNRPLSGSMEESWIRPRGGWFKAYRQFDLPFRSNEPARNSTPPSPSIRTEKYEP